MSSVKISFPVKQWDKDFAKLWLGFIGGIFLFGLFVNEFSKVGLIFISFLFVLGLYFFNKTIWNLADEVWDHGVFLRVKKSGKYQDIYFCEITNIDHPYSNHKHLITIKTKESNLNISFRAIEGTSWGWSSPAILKDLQNRIK